MAAADRSRVASTRARPGSATSAKATVATITSTASFTVRDDRDLTQIYQRDPDQPDEIASCDKHTGFDTISA